MQIQIVFNTQQQPRSNIISYQYAKQIQEIKKLEDELESKRESYRYLYGKRRGSWGRMTQADEKRSIQIDILKSKIDNLKSKLL